MFTILLLSIVGINHIIIRPIVIIIIIVISSSTMISAIIMGVVHCVCSEQLKQLGLGLCVAV